MSEKPYLDLEFFPQIVKHHSQFHRRLQLDNVADMRALFRGELASVVPYYPQILDSRYDEKILALERFLLQVSKDNYSNKIVRELYVAKIEEKIKLLHLVRCAAKAQLEPTEAIFSEFKELSETLFGTPKPAIFNDQVFVIKELLDQRLRSDLSSTPEIILLKKIFGSVECSSSRLLLPPQILAKVDDGIIYHDTASVLAYLRKKLAEVNLPGWRVAVHKRSRSFKVVTNKKVLYIPRSEILVHRKFGRALTSSRLDGLFAHEILTHAIRHERGITSPLQLLGIGLAGYLSGEEGVATYREQYYTGATDFAGFNSYLAISLAYGLDQGGKKRTAPEVCQIIAAYLKVSLNCSQRYAMNKAFSLCARTFILTPSGESMILTRDLVYREGNIQIHTLLKNNPSFDQRFDCGKFDPTNTLQVTSLQQLGII